METGNILVMGAGILLSVVFGYVPKAATWFEALGPQHKALFMVAMTAAAAQPQLAVVGHVRAVRDVHSAPVCPARVDAWGMTQPTEGQLASRPMSFGMSALRGTPGVVDHRLSRRHLINEFKRGRLRQDQVCDAHPELIRAARNIGSPASLPCPI